MSEEILEEKKEEKIEESTEEKVEEKTEELASENEDKKDTSDETKKEEKSENDKSEENKNDDKKEDDKKDKYKKFYEEEEPFVVKGVEKKNHKALKIALLSIAGLIGIVYLGGVYFFYLHFMANTKINGVDVSYMNSDASSEKVVEELTDAYSLTVNHKTGSLVITPEDLNIHLKLEKRMRDIRKRQNPWIWPVAIFTTSYDYYYKPYAHVNDDVEYENRTDNIYDNKAGYSVGGMVEARLFDYVDSQPFMDPANMEESINAKVRMEDGEVVVYPDETGTVLDADAVHKKLATALKNLDETVDLSYCYVKSDIQVSSDSIERGVNNATAFLDSDICYDFNGYEMPITKETLCTLAYIDNYGTVHLSESNIDAYARKFAREKSTCYTYRDFKTHDGEYIKVYGGWFGWQLDEDKCAEDLQDAMKRALAGERDIVLVPAYTHEGYSYGEENDIGDTYVEVDLSAQHVYVYVDGKLEMDTDCVTGNKAKGMTTPGGLYGFTGKGYKVTLIGDDYETPVTYWMPFNGGIGLHDATWRWSFGGEIYKYDGSHGCVNLPYNAAAQIFGIMEVGMPVVCYWR